ncbi:MAG: hypothetical protein H6832_16970 [Planctomycetes bacterium]|nr:hypothetical protein [Planctomycetota bacterium]MCB9890682.1 hypothetical protein [Planctomycetota bacterium]MCB9920095.1 hypothetical protein [Planctomycetota bacterium]
MKSTTAPWPSMVALTAMLVSGLQPCAPAQDNDTRRGAVLLTDGSALGGEIVGENERFLVFRHGDRILRIARDKVAGFEPQSELDRKIDLLAAHASSQTPFGRAQVGLQALSIGNFERALEIFGKLVIDNLSPPSRPSLERALAAELANRLEERSPRERARRFLLALPTKGRDASDRATIELGWRVLGEIFDAADVATSQNEGETDTEELRELEALVRKFARETFDPVRRRCARLALLARDAKSKQFVYRQAIAAPAGPTRDAIAADLRTTAQAESATKYLSAWIGKPNRGLEVRAVEALGTIGSRDAIPVLEALEASIPSRYKADAAAGSPRANVSFTTQQAYVADYDVEVATAAAIAKPIIRTATSGVVLDATVGSVWAIRYYTTLRSAVRSSLEKLRATK